MAQVDKQTYRINCRTSFWGWIQHLQGNWLNVRSQGTTLTVSSMMILFLSVILKLNQNARFQYRMENPWWRARWQIFARILVWKRFAGEMKNAAGRRQQIPGDESDFTLILSIRCVVTQYNLGCGTTGSKNTLTKVQILAMFLMRKNTEWTNKLFVSSRSQMIKPGTIFVAFLGISLP